MKLLHARGILSGNTGMSLVRVEGISTFIGSIKGKGKTATDVVLLSKRSSFPGAVATSAPPAKSKGEIYGFRNGMIG